MLRIARAFLLATLAALFNVPAAAAYPERPIRFLIPFPPGGGTDVLARALQDKLEAALGAGVIIDNRGGAGGTLGTSLAAKADPDGYTFLFTSASYTFQPSLYKNLPYQPLKDFKNVTMFASAPARVADSSVNHVYRAAAKVLQNPEVARRLALEGTAAVGNAPSEFDAFVRAEIAEWAKLIQLMNLRL